MRIVFFVVVMLACSLDSAGQVAGEITITGKVVDISSNKPIKAKISYKSLPTGGISGKFNDSIFSFSIFGSSRYEITAELPDYIPAVAIVDPAAAKEGIVVRELHLTPKGQTIRLTHLIFEQGKAVIDPASFGELDDLAQLLNTHPKLVIQLEGHTDALGSSSKNMDLSQDRVDKVKAYLVDKGVARARVKTKAFGGTRPVSKGKTEADRNLNRRVEIRILSE